MRRSVFVFLFFFSLNLSAEPTWNFCSQLLATFQGWAPFHLKAPRPQVLEVLSKESPLSFAELVKKVSYPYISINVTRMKTDGLVAIDSSHIPARVSLTELGATVAALYPLLEASGILQWSQVKRRILMDVFDHGFAYRKNLFEHTKWSRVSKLFLAPSIDQLTREGFLLFQESEAGTVYILSSSGEGLAKAYHDILVASVPTLLTYK